MFEFKRELKKELLDGRTSIYVANKIGITRQQLDSILNGRTTTRKLTAYCIVKACNSDAEIEDYFVRKEK
jgi:hypothetical protein